MRRTRGRLGNTPIFWQFVKSALDASFAPVMLVMDLPVRRIHTPIGRHSLPIFLSAFEALVLRVPSLVDVCRSQIWVARL